MTHHSSLRFLHAALTLALLGTLAACQTRPSVKRTSTLPPLAVPAELARPAPVPPPPVQSTPEVPPAAVAAIPVRPLQLQANCSFSDEAGYNGKAIADVREGEVRYLKVDISVPGKGQCLFDLAGMKQVKRLPSVELQGVSDACKVMLWEQGSRATIAFAGCASRCLPAQAFNYVWPVLVDRDTGRCN